MRDVGIADIGLVGRVEEDDGLVRFGIGDPRSELGLGRDGARWVVGKAKINQVRGGAGNRRYISIGRRAVEVGNALVAAIDVSAGAAGHDVRVDVNRINGIRDGEADVGGEYFLDVAAIALGTVGNENLICLDLAAPGGVIVLHDSFAQKSVALLGTIAFERGAVGHLVG